MGGFTIQISSLGKIPLQNAFLQSPCFNLRPSLTAIEVSSLDAVALSTGAYLSSWDHIRFSKFPKATIRDLARVGSPFISGLIVNRFMVGIACAASPCFRTYSKYSVVVISVKTSSPCRPSYSSSYAEFHILLSGLLPASAILRFAAKFVFKSVAETCQSIP